ncbi:MAG: 50S ribosomal protein L9 [Gammaproteobacteria bacterium]|nr:50S ribosomal protein L9 [Gammaproteobacteria bacterium]MDH4254452.1 50S ribosomal protein L9 [Gammaproteobacteria bacterium]MDH5309407.1 50S ribosomal protein L9 [Gammaproteobacteria bacterium]
MNVILLDKVENLGSIGDLVKVKPGYGRNYLIPTGKAALATPENLKEFESRRADLEKRAAEEVASAKARAELVTGMDLVIRANVGGEGKLFGSVGPADIVEAFEKVGVEVSRSEIRMPDGPLHEVGDYVITLHLHSDVNVDITVRVVAED